MPDDIHTKVALEAVVCATQLDGFGVAEVNGNLATWDVHIFGPNPMWSSCLGSGEQQGNSWKRFEKG